MPAESSEASWAAAAIIAEAPTDQMSTAPIFDAILNIAAVLIGIWVVLLALFSLIQSFVLPRSAPDRILRVVFLAVRRTIMPFINWSKTVEARERIIAFNAPVALVVLPLVWLLIITLGFTFIFWGLGVKPVETALVLSGSSLFTLGFASSNQLLITLVAFAEAAIGLILIALLIAYLPTMYSAFARRERVVTQFEVLGGVPPSGIEVLVRIARFGHVDDIVGYCNEWRQWFIDINESHTSLAPLVFFRSPKPNLFWLSVAGSMLDAAAIYRSTVKREAQQVGCGLCIRSGYSALRDIATFFGIPHDVDPDPGSPISISKDEFFKVVYERLREENIPVLEDKEACWRAYAGWRVNYDGILIELARLTMAPYALWVSDRSRVDLPPQ